MYGHIFGTAKIGFHRTVPEKTIYSNSSDLEGRYFLPVNRKPHFMK